MYALVVNEKWQIAYYNVKRAKRVTQQDHTAKLEVYHRNDTAVKRVEDMHKEGYFDVYMTKLHDKCPIDSWEYDGKDWTEVVK
jgi:hypothetical protein